MKKEYKIALVSTLILVLGFVLCRFVFFDIHGMKQLPLILFVCGLVVTAVSSLCKCKFVPIANSVGYIIAFVIAVIFESDYADPTGAMTMNNLWIIWTVAYLCFVVIGIVAEIVKRHRKR